MHNQCERSCANILQNSNHFFFSFVRHSAPLWSMTLVAVAADTFVAAMMTMLWMLQWHIVPIWTASYESEHLFNLRCKFQLQFIWHWLIHPKHRRRIKFKCKCNETETTSTVCQIGTAITWHHIIIITVIIPTHASCIWRRIAYFWFGKKSERETLHAAIVAIRHDDDSRLCNLLMNKAFNAFLATAENSEIERGEMLRWYVEVFLLLIAAHPRKWQWHIHGNTFSIWSELIIVMMAAPATPTFILMCDNSHIRV